MFYRLLRNTLEILHSNISNNILKLNTHIFILTAKPLLRCRLLDEGKVALKDRWPLKGGPIHMKFYLKGQGEGGPLIKMAF